MDTPRASTPPSRRYFWLLLPSVLCLVGGILFRLTEPIEVILLVSAGVFLGNWLSRDCLAQALQILDATTRETVSSDTP